MGRVSQILPLETPAIHLGSHPLVVDAIGTHTFDHAKPEKRQTRKGGLSTSPTLDGSTGPFLSVSASESVTEYIGPEKVKTPVGTFDTHHYQRRPPPSERQRSQPGHVGHAPGLHLRPRRSARLLEQ
jgi:hypothetical protein